MKDAKEDTLVNATVDANGDAVASAARSLTLAAQQQSRATTPASAPLVTTSDNSIPASTVAGTCTVIDAIMMEICTQSPNEDYCGK